MGHEALEAEKKYPSGWKIGSLRCKNSQALLFLERIFLFLDLDCQNLATLGFDNCPISEKKNSLSEKKLRLRVFPSQSNLFPAARNYYSLLLEKGCSEIINRKDEVSFPKENFSFLRSDSCLVEHSKVGLSKSRKRKILLRKTGT